MRPSILRLVLALVAVVLVAAACSAPPVSVRRTAVAPLATAPVRTGRPLDNKEVRVSFRVEQSLSGPQPSSRVGGLYYDDIEAEFWVPDVEDAGVRIPQTQFGGSVYFGLNEYFELGLQVMAGPNSLAEANYPAHVIDFDAGPSVRFGPGLRGNIPVSPNFAISLVGELDVLNVPQATFVCRNAGRIGTSDTGDPNEPISGWCTTNDEFELEKIENHAALFGSIMLEPVVMVNEMFAITLHGGVSTGVQNIGFDPFKSRADESTLSTYATPFFGFGAEARFDYFFIGTGFDFLFPVIDEVGAMPVFSVTIGGRVPGRTERTNLDAAPEDALGMASPVAE